MSGLAVNKANLFGYSIMAFPLAFAGIPLYIHAPDFYSAALGASLTSIGAILLILRILDALADPFIGYYSDKYSNKRNAILTLGIFLLATGFFGLFNPIEEYLMASFTINVFLATFGFSIISINLNTLGGIWSDNYNEKTKISAAREAFGLIGLIFAAALPAVLISKFGNNEGFQYFS